MIPPAKSTKSAKSARRNAVFVQGLKRALIRGSRLARRFSVEFRRLRRALPAGDRALEPLLLRRGATQGRKSLPHSSAGTLGSIHTPARIGKAPTSVCPAARSSDVYDPLGRVARWHRRSAST